MNKFATYPRLSHCASSQEQAQCCMYGGALLSCDLSSNINDFLIAKAAPRNAMVKVETNTREQGSAHDEDGIEEEDREVHEEIEKFFRDMIGSPRGDDLKTEYWGFL